MQKRQAPVKDDESEPHASHPDVTVLRWGANITGIRTQHQDHLGRKQTMASQMLQHGLASVFALLWPISFKVNGLR